MVSLLKNVMMKDLSHQVCGSSTNSLNVKLQPLDSVVDSTESTPLVSDSLVEVSATSRSHVAFI